MHAKKWISAVVFLAAMAWLVAGVLADPTEGEGDSDAVADKSGQQKIALLNVGEVMKNLTWLKKQLEELKSEANEIQAALKSEAEEVNRLKERVESLGPATPDPDELRHDLVKAQAALAAKIQVKQQELQMREAKAYSSAFDAMSKEVREYGEAKGFSMVLRLVDNPMSGGSPQAVLSKMNRGVVWHDSKCDITSVILARMNAVNGPL